MDSPEDQEASSSKKSGKKKSGRRVGLKTKKADLNLSCSRLMKVLGLNTSANRSMVQKTTLRTNNKALARALAVSRQETRQVQADLMEKTRENQALMLQVTNLERAAGIQNGEIEAEVDRRVDLQRTENRSLLNQIISQLMGTVTLLGKALDNTTSRGSSIGSREPSIGSQFSRSGSEGGKSNDSAAPQRSIYNSIHQSAPRLFSNTVVDCLSSEPVCRPSANMSLIAEAPGAESPVEEDSNGDTPTTSTFVSESSVVKSRLPQRVPRKDISATCSVGKPVKSAAELLEQNNRICEQQETKHPNEKTVVPVEAKPDDDHETQEANPPKRSRKRQISGSDSKTASKKVNVHKNSSKGVTASKSEPSLTKQSARRGTFVVSSKPDTAEVVVSKSSDGGRDDSSVGVEPLRRETFALPSRLQDDIPSVLNHAAVIKPVSRDTSEASQPDVPVDVLQDDIPVDVLQDDVPVDVLQDDIPLRPPRLTYFVPNPFKRSTKCNDKPEPETAMPESSSAEEEKHQHVGSGKSKGTKGRERRGTYAVSKETSKYSGTDESDSPKASSKSNSSAEEEKDQHVDSARSKGTKGRERRGTYAVSKETSKCSGADAPAESDPPKIASKSRRKSRRGTFVVENPATSESIEDEDMAVLVDRSLDVPELEMPGMESVTVDPDPTEVAFPPEPQRKTKLVAQPQKSQSHPFQYGANMTMDDDQTMIMEADMEFTETLNFPIILGMQSSIFSEIQESEKPGNRPRAVIPEKLDGGKQESGSADKGGSSEKDTDSGSGSEHTLVGSNDSESDQEQIRNKDRGSTGSNVRSRYTKQKEDGGLAKGSNTTGMSRKVAVQKDAGSSSGSEPALTASEDSAGEGNEKNKESNKNHHVEVRLGKLGDVRYAAGRKDADGVRGAVPLKLPTKTRSKQKKVKPPVCKPGSKEIFQQDQASAGPPSIFDYHDKTPRVTKEKTVYDISINDSAFQNNEKCTLSEYRQKVSAGDQLRSDNVATDLASQPPDQENIRKIRDEPKVKSRTKTKDACKPSTKRKQKENSSKPVSYKESSDEDESAASTSGQRSSKPKGKQRRRSARIASVESSDAEEKAQIAKKVNEDYQRSRQAAREAYAKVKEKLKAAEESEKCAEAIVVPEESDVPLSNSLTSILINSPELTRRVRQKKRVTIAIISDNESDLEGLPKRKARNLLDDKEAEESPIMAMKRRQSRIVDDSSDEEEDKENARPPQRGRDSSKPKPVPQLKHDVQEHRSKRTSHEMEDMYQKRNSFGDAEEDMRKRPRRGTKSICYAEPSVGKKLRQGDVQFGSAQDSGDRTSKGRSQSKGKKSSIAT